MTSNLQYPKISIITPNFNGEKYIEETIKSILEQNYPNLEYIIIDGGSTDNSINIIKKYESKLAYWISESDSCMYEAIQKGFDRSTGQIMAWLNSDDMYHKKSLYTVAEIFSNLSHIKWITGCNTHYDDEGRTLSTKQSYEHSRYDMFLNPQKYIQQESTFWRRALWDSTGKKIDTSLKFAGDFELWIRFFRHAKLYRTSALIGGFRVRNCQISQTFMTSYISECKKVLKKEKTLMAYYDQCMLDEIVDLRLEVKSLNITIEKKNTIEASLHDILDYPESIVCDIRHKKFNLETNMSIEELKRKMSNKRQNMKDFLYFIKNKQKFYPDVIIDVGVANGTFELYDTFPKSQLILVEPIEEFSKCLNALQKKYDKVKVYPVAAGKSSTNMNIYVHDDLHGSSLYAEEEGDITNGQCRKISVKPLDDLCSRYIHSEARIILKIDVQGAELDVLEGSKRIMQNIDIIILEVSLHKFFLNGPEFYEIIEYMHKIGYVVYDIFGFLNRPLDEALAQVDIAFIKQDSSFRASKCFATPEQRKIMNKNCQDSNNTTVKMHQKDRERISFQAKFNNSFEQIEALKKKNKKYLVYGNASIGKMIKALIPENIIAFIDQKSDLISSNIKKGEVYSPKNIPNMNYDKIIISVLGRENEIEDFLVNELSISKEKIVWLIL
jgi:FkbM family methyltransferase